MRSLRSPPGRSAGSSSMTRQEIADQLDCFAYSAADSRDSLPTHTARRFPYQPGDYLGSISGTLATGGRHNIAMPAGVAVQQPTAHMCGAPWERYSPDLRLQMPLARVSRERGAGTRATELRTAILNNSELKIEDARRRADAIFNKNTQPGLDVVDQQRQFQQRETEKLLRLRALRLAKEATDREAQASSGGRPGSRPKSKRLRQIG